MIRGKALTAYDDGNESLPRHEGALVLIKPTHNTQRCPDLVGKVRRVVKMNRNGKTVLCGKLCRVTLFQVDGSDVWFYPSDLKSIDVSVSSSGRLPGKNLRSPSPNRPRSPQNSRTDAATEHGRHAIGACSQSTLRSRIQGFGNGPTEDEPTEPIGTRAADAEGFWGTLAEFGEEIGFGFNAHDAEALFSNVFVSFEKGFDSITEEVTNMISPFDRDRTSDTIEYSHVTNQRNDIRRKVEHHFDELDVRPGFYRIVAICLEVTAAKSEQSDTVMKLDEGQLVHVVEVAKSSSTGNWRGRIKDASGCGGWIDFLHADTGELLAEIDLEEEARSKYRDIHNIQTDHSKASHSVPLLGCDPVPKSADIMFGFGRDDPDLEWTTFQSAPVPLDDEESLDILSPADSCASTEAPVGTHQVALDFAEDLHFHVETNGEPKLNWDKSSLLPEPATSQLSSCGGIGFRTQALASDKSLGIVFQGSFEDVPGFLEPVEEGRPLDTAYSEHESVHTSSRAGCRSDDSTVLKTLAADRPTWIRPAMLPRGLSIFDPLSAKNAEFADAFPGL